MNLSTGRLYKELIKEHSGLYITGEQLKKLQSVLMDITEDIFDACEECGATCFLIGGNALGAVRHHGFIPWDDDIDLGIVAKDYEKFVCVFKEKYGNKYDVLDENAPKCCSPIAYCSLKGTVYRELGSDDDKHGISVGIERVHNVPNNFLLRCLHGILCDGMGLLMSSRNFYETRNVIISLTKGNAKAERTFKAKIAIGWCTKFLSVQRLNKITQYIYGLCKNEQSRYINIPCGSKHYFGDMYLRNEFFPPKKMKYEGHIWNVPADPDKYLTKLYGADYMIVPPESKRDKHLCYELKFPEETNLVYRDK